MRIQSGIILSLAIALTIPSAASAQEDVGVAITLQVAGQPYQFEGKAECQHEPAAYIYSVPSEMWSVHQNDGRRSINLSLWRPRNASGDMFSLSMGIRGNSHLINTIKVPGEKSAKGAGKVTFTRSGAGGTFTINATTADGAVITGTIKCSAFTAAVAEGG
jgi:hypothetical protein